MPERAAAQLVLQHNLWEPQHVRGQAQDTDIPKFFSIPLQPAVCPALEAQKRCQWSVLLLPRLPFPPLTLLTSLREDWAGSGSCDKRFGGDGTKLGLRPVMYSCVEYTLHNQGSIFPLWA